MNGHEWEPMYRQERREALRMKGADRAAAEREHRRRVRAKRWELAGLVITACIATFVTQVGIGAWNHRSMPAPIVSYQGCYQDGDWTRCSDHPKPDPAKWFSPRYWGANNDTSNADFPARTTSDGRRTYEVRDLMGRSI